MSAAEVGGLEAQVRARRGDFTLDVNLTLPGSGISCLFGPSGAGKTTLLRCLAGLTEAAGRVTCRGAVWQDDARGVRLPVHARRVGYVFQDAALFPHLSVAGNLDYAEQRVPAAEQACTRADVVGWLGLEPLLERDPRTLSGGQRQRAAIARALLSAPRLLLMDEPVASLDLAARSEVLDHLQRVQRRLALPVVYVTHSPDEVARLADHVVWLDQGRARAAGPTPELLGRLELGVTLGGDAVSALAATVREHDPDYPQTVLDCPWGPLRVARLDRAPGEVVRVRLRASDVSVDLDPPGRSSISNVLEVRVLGMSPLQDGEVLVRLGGPPAASEEALLARITTRSRDLLELAEGAQVYARVKAVSLS
ncbi:MAG: molybdenum ABC transporter ATP-binding protein [Planctomycetes bacterium]|nr:molybdenum ABC transporter ATP-binding protein [Planctomycetota bacterium]